jgi:hypothetical protein
MQALRHRRVTNLKDKAYSMYGVLQALGVRLTAPDYTQHPAIIFPSFYRDLLAWQPAMLALLTDAGSPKRNTDITMPTWVPCWQTAPSSWIPAEVLYTSLDESGVQHISTYGFPIFEVLSSRLKVWARPEDSVVACYQLACHLENPNLLVSEALWAVLAWSTRVLNTLKPQTQDAIDKLVNSLLMTLDIGATDSPLVKRTIAFAFDLKALINSIHETFKQDQDLKAPDYTEAEKMVDRMVDRLRSPEHSENERNWHARILLSLQDKACGKRLLFVTKSGRFGTGSMRIRPGDVVHFVSGVPVPLALRENSQVMAYEVIGPCMLNEQKGDFWNGKFEPIELI